MSATGDGEATKSAAAAAESGAKEEGKSASQTEPKEGEQAKSKVGDESIGSKNEAQTSDGEQTAKTSSKGADGAGEGGVPSEGGAGEAPPADVPDKAVEAAKTKEVAKVYKARVKGEKATQDNCKFGFIGAGKMTEAIIRGLLEKKCGTDRFFVSSKGGKNHDQFKQLSVTVTKRCYDIFGKYDCDVIFMATHGLVVKECFKMGGLRPLALTTNFIPTRSSMIYLLSLIGGITVADCKKVLLNPDNPEKYKIEAHRIMLNHSVSRAIGIGAIDAEIDSKKVSAIVRDILFKIAKVEYYPEAQMDMLCAVGGNGIAFTYYFVSAMADGGFKMGLPKKAAVSLATKTLHCTALCMLESGKHPSELRDLCTSPSGPAIYGIANLEKRDCASGIGSAIEAANKRIKELVDSPLYT